MEVFEQHWDEVLRLKASIGAGLVPPSLILRSSRSSQHHLGKTASIVRADQDASGGELSH
jgi:hypothetical protein